MLVAAGKCLPIALAVPKYLNRHAARKKEHLCEIGSSSSDFDVICSISRSILTGNKSESEAGYESLKQLCTSHLRHEVLQLAHIVSFS